MVSEGTSRRRLRTLVLASLLVAAPARNGAPVRRRTVHHALAIALLTGTTGCITLREDARSRSDAPEPSARRIDDGIETWDLSGEPTEQALGIADDSRAGIYETEEPRTIHLELPQGRSARLEAELLTFERSRGAHGDSYRLGARLGDLDAEELGDRIKDVLGQLDIPTDEVDDFVAEATAAPPDQTESVRFSSPTTTIGALSLGVSAHLAPIAGTGRLVVGGTWT